VLKSDADTFVKARACQQLALIGPPEAVPALAALLGDEKLGNHARAALEAMPDPAAAAALREALGRLQGKLLIGAVNSIGVRRDPQAVEALIKLTGDAASGCSSEALLSLGRIATPEALATLQKTLASGPAGLRPAAAEGCLLAAERQMAGEKREAAVALYDAVRGADVPAPLRVAAAHGAIRARQAAGLPLLLEMLKSGDPALVRVAIRSIRELPGPEVTRAVVAALEKELPDIQTLMVAALADRNDPAALGALEVLAAGDAAEVRVAALKALGKVGAGSSVPVLLKAVLNARDDAEAAVPAAALVQLRAPEADAAIAASLAAAPPAARARLIGILADRGAAGAVGDLVKLASDADATIAKAAFRALATLARPGDLAGLVRLAASAKDESVRGTAEGAVVEASVRLSGPSGRSAPILAALPECKEAAAKGSLLRMLAAIGDMKALAAATAALADPDAVVQEAALKCLADWPDATAAPALLVVVAGATDPERRKTALRGAVRAARLAVADGANPSGQGVGWMVSANAAARDAADKRIVLSGLAALKCVAGLQMIEPLLGDPEVADDAALALIQVAKQLPPSPPRLMAKALIEKVLAATKNGTVRSQSEKILKEIPGDGVALPSPAAESRPEPDLAKLEFRPLFDGRTLSGWEGDTYASFRVEDGAIVGGNLQRPVPRNEFLCTTRSFSDFVLRVECKLVKSNAGIQIRSRRIAGSSEVCGYQADMDCGANGGLWGCLYDESRRGMLVTADRTAVKGAVKADDWNQYEIRCIGPRLRLFVNGVQTADYTEKDPAILRSGLIGLQIHAGGPSEAWYRNLSIAEVP
jgi:HEAT repeat protein